MFPFPKRASPAQVACKEAGCAKAMVFGKLLKAKLTAYRRANNIKDPNQKWNDLAAKIAFDNAKYFYEHNLNPTSRALWNQNRQRWNTGGIPPMKCLGQINCKLTNIKSTEIVTLKKTTRGSHYSCDASYSKTNLVKNGAPVY